MKFNNTETFLSLVENRRRNGKKLKGLKTLFQHYHNPHLTLRCIHVGGTNGKGSTLSVMASILKEAGYKVGTFTSPYLECHHDRIRVDGEYMEDEVMLRYANCYYEEWMKYELSSFEIDMFMAVFYFIEKKVDYALFEVGLGGTQDATNVLFPLASIITNIGMDHMELLGNTYKDIAQAKAGIIKFGVPIYTMERKKECLTVFEEKAISLNSELIVCEKPMDVYVDDLLHFRYLDMNVKQPTLALYQADNTALAMRVLFDLHKKGVIKLNEEVMLKGIRKAHWSGRFEVVSKEPRIILDGAHNLEGIKALVASCINIPNLKILFSALKDKPYKEMLECLCSISDDVMVCEFDFYRAESAENIALGSNARIVDYHNVVGKLKDDETLLICGSLYFISMMRAFLVRNKDYLD